MKLAAEISFCRNVDSAQNPSIIAGIIFPLGGDE
jgi:hypothetical protein